MLRVAAKQNVAEQQRPSKQDRMPQSARLARRKVMRAPAILAGVMLLIGSVTCVLSGVNPVGLVAPYFFASIAVTLVSVFIFTFIEIASLARTRPDKPLRIVLRKLRPRAWLLLLPTVIFPAFLVGFTAAKTSIPFLVGYAWDGVWAAADRWIFGDDVWRLTHGWLGVWSMPIWEWLYTFGWGAILMYTASLVALYASARNIAVFFTAMMLTWLLGGWLMAYSFSAAGPVFAPLVDPSLAGTFNPLRELLSSSLSADGSVRVTQDYLADALHSRDAVKGGGISAMPSMHLGAASIYVLAARGTKWLIPAIVFWALIFIGSGYFGYHYWVDGLAAAPIAWLCWRTADFYFRPRHDQ